MQLKGRKVAGGNGESKDTSKRGLKARKEEEMGEVKELAKGKKGGGLKGLLKNVGSGTRRGTQHTAAVPLPRYPVICPAEEESPKCPEEEAEEEGNTGERRNSLP